MRHTLLVGPVCAPCRKPEYVNTSKTAVRSIQNSRQSDKKGGGPSTV